MSPSPSPSPVEGYIPIIVNEANVNGVKAIGLAILLAIIVFAVIRRR